MTKHNIPQPRQPGKRTDDAPVATAIAALMADQRERTADDIARACKLQVDAVKAVLRSQAYAGRVHVVSIQGIRCYRAVTA